MIIPFERIYTGVILLKVTQQVLYMRVPTDSTIKTISLYRPSSGISGSWIFNCRLAGAALFSGGDRPTFTSGVEEVHKTGLNFAANAGDILLLDLEAKGSGGIPGPLVWVVEFDDGVITSGVAGPISSADGNFATFDGVDGQTIQDSAIAPSTDGTFASNSDAKIPTEKAIETRIANRIAAYIAAQDVERIVGAINCSTNPNYPAADAGHIYRVSVAGKIGGASGPNVEVNDRLECFVDSTASGNHATVGANWLISQSNLDVSSFVAGLLDDANAAAFLTSLGLTANGQSLVTAANYAAMKTLLSLVKGDVGLGNVDNTSNATERAATATLENKRVKTRVVTEASNATPTPDVSTTDEHTITAQAAAAAFAAPTGTPVEGDGLIIRIKDNGTARALTWNAIYRGIGVTLPATTVLSKTLYVAMIYNATDTKWDVVAVCQET